MSKISDLYGDLPDTTPSNDPAAPAAPALPTQPRPKSKISQVYGDIAAQPSQPAAAQAEPEKRYNVLGGLADVGRMLYDIPVQTKAAFGHLAEGGEDPLAAKDWKDTAIAAGEQRAKERAALPGGEEYVLPFIQRKDIRDAGQSTGFSAVAMGAGLGAGLGAGAVGGPVAGYGAGIAASGAAAFQMDRNMFTRQIYEALNEESLARTGKPVSAEDWAAKLAASEEAITRHGLWEAVPEAIGNAGAFAIITKPLVGILGKNVVTRLAGKMGGMYGTELATETVTQTGQHNAEMDAGIAPPDAQRRSLLNPADLAESFKEVAPQTLVLTTVMGGAGLATDAAYNKLRGETEQPPPIQRASDVVEETRAVIQGLPRPDQVERGIRIAMPDGSVATSQAEVEGFIESQVAGLAPEQQQQAREALWLRFANQGGPGFTQQRRPISSLDEDGGEHGPTPIDIRFRRRLINDTHQGVVGEGQPVPGLPSMPQPGRLYRPARPPIIGQGPLEAPAAPQGLPAGLEESPALLRQGPQRRILAQGPQEGLRPEFGPPAGLESPTGLIRPNRQGSEGSAQFNAYRQWIEQQTPDGLREAPGMLEQIRTDERLEDGETERLSELFNTKAAPGATTDQTTEIDQAANQAATSPENNTPQPTQAQIEAGNYQKGHIKVHGFDITVENPKGSKRSGVDPNGQPWEVTMPAHYGYLKRTQGADGEQVDVYVGPALDSEVVYIVDQVDPDTGRFDEHKVIIGTRSPGEAIPLYESGFSDGRGRERLGALTPLSVQEFRKWLRAGNTEKPVSEPEAPRNYGTLERPDVRELSHDYAKTLFSGKAFKNIVEARKVAEDKLGGRIKPGTPAAKAVDEAVELAAVKVGRAIINSNDSPRQNYDRLVDLLLNRMPNLGVRTSTSVQQQAYSTPLPIAYLASRLAGINQDTTVYEPTAGNGALLIEANTARTLANELNKERAKSLHALGFHVKAKDATQFSPPESNWDVVITNPPFGIVKDEQGATRRYRPDPNNPRYETGEIDHAIALKALQAMKDDGSAVLILGSVNKQAKSEKARSDAYHSKPKREFYYTLYNQYNVVDHFTVSGDLYAKQGAGWPIDIVVIRGRGKSARPLPAAETPPIYESFEAIKGKLDARYESSVPSGQAASLGAQQPVGAATGGATSGQPDNANDAGVPSGADVSGAVDGGTGNQSQAGNGGRSTSNSGSGRSGLRGANQQSAGVRNGRDAEPGAAGENQPASGGQSAGPGAVGSKDNADRPQGAQANKPGAVGGNGNVSTPRGLADEIASATDADIDALFDELMGDSAPSDAQRKITEAEKQAIRDELEDIAQRYEVLNDNATAASVRAAKHPIPDWGMDLAEYRKRIEKAEAKATKQSKPKANPRTQFQQAKQVNPAEDSLTAAIAKLGGLDRAEAERQGIDTPDLKKKGWRILPIFSRTGRSFDAMAEALSEYRYPVFNEQGNYDANTLLDALDRELRGNPVYAPEGVESAAEREAAEREAALLEEDPFLTDLAPGELLEEDEYTEEMDPEGRRMLELADIANGLEEAAGEDIVERGAVQGKPNSAIIEELEAFIHERENAGRNRAGEAAPEQGQGASTEAPDLELTGQTDAEIRAEQERLRAAAALAKQQEETARHKAAADRERDQFELTGSTAPADRFGSRQADLVEESRKAEKKPTDHLKIATDEAGAAINDALQALWELTGGPGTLKSGPFAFDENTYQKVVPLLKSALEHTVAAGRALKDFVAAVMEQAKQFPREWIDAVLRPAVKRFVSEVQQGVHVIEGLSKPKPKAAPQEQATEGQVPYEPKSQSGGLGTLVPIKMRSAVADALERLAAKVGDIDAYVADQLGYERSALGDYFSAEQVDALALALSNFDKGAGFIIGDQTGIGKGRVVAAMIRYALKQGATPIFVTEKPNLYADMVRDLTDIGMPDVKPLMTNAGLSVPIDEEGTKALKTKGGAIHNALLNKLANEANLGEYDAIFTTYNQMQTVKGEMTARMMFLDTFAKDGFVIFDESHNAGGSKQDNQEDDGKPEKLDRAAFARRLASMAKGVFYSSATYAKRPSVMDLYFRTDMALAVPNIRNLGEAISKGGVPMQQVVANMLAKAGQYIRRERSFAGVTYDTRLSKVDRKTYADFSHALKRIQDFSEIYVAASKERMDKRLKAEARRTSPDGSTGGAGAESTNFTAVMHNLIDQMLLAAKADAAVQEALEALARNEKPVITVANTMGAFIADYADQVGINPGDRIDIGFQQLLLRYLERSRVLTIRKPFEGGGERRVLTDQDLGEGGVRFFEQTKAFIESRDFSSLPVSPIDYIRAKLRESGYKVGEITGRTHIIDYKPDGTAVYTTRKGAEISIAGRRKAITDFNSRKLDVMVLNQAGATGLSLHASEKFKDQRKRFMIIAQAEKNVDTHMQMLGRVHRTGQVVTPGYAQLVADVPAEKRPAAVLAKKMASLNANTTASRKGALTAENVPDFLNQYGDEVVASIMEDNPELHRKLGAPLPSDKQQLSRADAARKISGRIPLLPVEEQESLYEQIESEYSALMQQLEAMGMNALEAKALPLDAKPMLKSEFVKPRSSLDSPFAEGADVEVMNIKRLSRPYTQAQVIKLLQESLQSNAETLIQLQEEGRKQATTLYDAAGSEFATYRSEMLDEIDNDKRRDAQETRLNGLWDRFEKTLELASVGQTVRLTGPDQTYYGVVTRVQNKGSAKNPIALGGWKATVAVADGARQFTIPFSKLFTPENRPDLTGMGQFVIEEATHVSREGDILGELTIVDAFDKLQSQSRENRAIITGNLLAAFDATGGRGSIIQFTDHAGKQREGILMPEKWDAEAGASQRPVEFTTPDQVTAYLNYEGVINVESADGALQIRKQGAEYRIAVAAAKAKGGRYYLNSAVLAAAGRDFVKVGDTMRMDLPLSNARRAIAALIDIGAQLQAKSHQDAARAIVKINEGETRDVGAKYSRAQASGSTPDDLVTALDAAFGKVAVRKLVAAGKLELHDDTRLLAAGNHPEDVAGLYEGGAIHLFAPNVPAGEAANVLLHESVHAALESFVGTAEFNRILDFVERQAKAGKGVFAKAAARIPADTNPAHRREELLAYTVEISNGKLPIIRRLIARVRNFLRSLGLVKGYTDADLVALTRSALLRMAEGDSALRVGGSLYHRAWHGSPHDFERFNLSGIGTGEGAQVYGHGLYFASQKAVAEAYRNALGTPEYKIDGVRVEEHPLFKETRRDLQGFFSNNHIYEWLEVAAEEPITEADIKNTPVKNTAQMEAQKYAEKLIGKTVEHYRGRLYEVELAPELDEYLDWDKPLSEQSEKVKAALKRWAEIDGRGWNEVEGFKNGSLTGEKFYNSAASFKSAKIVSQDLHKAGIPGIKYLDGGSRGKGDGTHNFVIFDDSLISVQAKYSRRASGNPTLDAALAKIGRSDASGLLGDLRAYRGQPWSAIKTDLASKARRLGDEIIQGIVDRYHGIKLAEQAVHGRLLPAEQSGYVAARLSTGLASTMRAFLLHGVGEYRGGIVRKKANSEGLFDALEPVKDDMQDFLHWMVGLRADKLAREGRENLFTPDEIAALKGLSQGREQRFREAFRRYGKWKQGLLDFAESAGLIDPQARALFEHAEYIPFYRVMDPGNIQAPRQGGQSLSHQSAGIVRLRGGTNNLGDPLENILINAARLINASLKNHALESVISELQGTPYLTEVDAKRFEQEVIPLGQVKSRLRKEIVEEQLSQGAFPDDAKAAAKLILDMLPADALQGFAKLWAVKAPKDPDIVRVMRNGQSAYYRVHDRALLRSLTALQDTPLRGFLLDLARSSKRIFTAAITATPDFIIRNFLRDSLHTWTISKGKHLPFHGAVKGAVKAFQESGGAENMLFAGASFQAGHINSHDPDSLERIIRISLREKGIHGAAADSFMGTIAYNTAALWDRYRKLGNAAENANREAKYEEVLGRGGSVAEAVFEARDLLDFSMRGDWQAAAIITDTIPFLNARIQGLYKLGRSAHGRSFFLRAAALTLAGLVLWAWNQDDERYKELEDWQKHSYWHLWIGDQHVRIPKPFEIGLVFGTIPEAAAESAFGDENGRYFRDALKFGLTQTLAVEWPQLIRPALEVSQNRVHFTGRPIENMGDQSKPDSLRYSVHTSDTARLLGSLVSDQTGISPKEIQHLIRGYFGEMGMYALGASDALVRLASGAPSKPSARLDDWPLAGALLQSDPPRSTKYATRFYDMLQQSTEAHRALRALLTESASSEVIQARRENTLPALRARRGLETTNRGLQALRKQEENIMRSDLSSAEKRRRLDALARRKALLTQRAVERFGEGFGY